MDDKANEEPRELGYGLWIVRDDRAKLEIERLARRGFLIRVLEKPDLVKKPSED